MKLLFSFILTLSFTNFTLAEDVVYKPVSIHGKPFYYNVEKSSWELITKDVSIKENEKVRLGKSNYLLLSSTSGFLEFNIEGTYDLAEYKGRIMPLNNLARDFMNSGVDSLLKRTPKRIQLYEQELLEAKTSEDLLSIYPSPTFTYEKEIELIWRPMNDNIYVVKMYHTEQSIYFYREVKGDRISINMSKLHIPTDRCIYWTVGVKGSEYWSTPKCIYIINMSESSNIELERYDIENQLNLKRSAAHNLLFALFYEQNGIMHMAENYYRLAWDLSNHSDRYKEIYYNFLDRRNKKVIE